MIGRAARVRARTDSGRPVQDTLRAGRKAIAHSGHVSPTRTHLPDAALSAAHICHDVHASPRQVFANEHRGIWRKLRFSNRRIEFPQMTDLKGVGRGGKRTQGARQIRTCTRRRIEQLTHPRAKVMELRLCGSLVR